MRCDAPRAVDLAALLARGGARRCEPRAGAAAAARAASTRRRRRCCAGDRFLLRQALANLLDNALDFSPPGGAIELRRCGDEGGGCAARSRPRPGRARLRARSACSSASIRCRVPTAARSTGLGLPFVREVARLHGGEARLGNRDGGGARGGAARCRCASAALHRFTTRFAAASALHRARVQHASRHRDSRPASTRLTHRTCVCAASRPSGRRADAGCC